MKRRNFIKSTAIGAAGISVASPSFASLSNLSGMESRRTIHVFTKCLQFLNFDEIGEVLARYGFDGADLTVRPGGQILPENVKTDLPKAMKALQKHGVGSDMITTRINDPDDKNTAPILKTMADLGIRYYRMGYLTYDDKLSVVENLDRHKKTVEKLEKLNREYGVTANYQNHSGTRIGGPVWDLYHLLKDSDPEYIGVQYDIRHATVEGGVSWPIGMKLLAPWIRTTDIKDFIWAKNDEGEWKIKNVPLGEGMIDFEKYFNLYKSMNIEAPVSIHYEYDLGGAEHGDQNPDMSREEIYSWLDKDLKFLKNQFNKYGL
jgi:sugar phosphate isomerase/epimerase